MGDGLKKTARRGLALGVDPITDKIGQKAGKMASKAAEKPFRTGATAARRDAASALKEQQQKEGAKLAEATSEVEEKRAMAQSGRGGRRSLIKSSSGLATTLGG